MSIFLYNNAPTKVLHLKTCTRFLCNTKHAGPNKNSLNETREFMDQLAFKLNLKQMKDWYYVSKKDVLDNGGRRYVSDNISLHQVLTLIYPNYEWLPWKFATIPVGYWNSIDNQRKFIIWFQSQRNINEMTDWYTISSKV